MGRDLRREGVREERLRATQRAARHVRLSPLARPLGPALRRRRASAHGGGAARRERGGDRRGSPRSRGLGSAVDAVAAGPQLRAKSRRAVDEPGTRQGATEMHVHRLAEGLVRRAFKIGAELPRVREGAPPPRAAKLYRGHWMMRQNRADERPSRGDGRGSSLLESWVCARHADALADKAQELALGRRPANKVAGD